MKKSKEEQIEEIALLAKKQMRSCVKTRFGLVTSEIETNRTTPAATLLSIIDCVELFARHGINNDK